MDDLYETIVGKDDQLKPENYLSSRELSDRQMSDQALMVLNYLWNKLTGQPEMPMSFIGLIFGTVVCGAMMLAFYGIVIMPIIYFIDK